VEFIDSLCCLAGRQGASDIFLHAERAPQFRINGELVTIGSALVHSEELESLWTQCGAALNVLDYDGSYIASDGTRFRVNLFRTLFKHGAVLRPIKTVVPTLDTLGVPVELLASWVTRPAGLVLVTGPTGAG